jgi:hypothetical protein
MNKCPEPTGSSPVAGGFVVSGQLSRSPIAAFQLSQFQHISFSAFDLVSSIFPISALGGNSSVSAFQYFSF